MYLRDEYRNGSRLVGESLNQEFISLFFQQPEVNHLFQNYLKKPYPKKLSKKSQMLVTAFIHQSFSHECKLSLESSAEQLEFLGDSVLGLIISEYLYETYRSGNEGDYSKARNTLVNESKLAEFARLLKFDRLIFLGRGELAKKGFERDSLLADTFEAFLAAVYLNYGLTCTRHFIQQILKQADHQVVNFEHARLSDAKSSLQEYCLSHFKQFPEYSAEEINRDGKVKFACQVKLDGKILNQGIFDSKKKGHKQLAKVVLHQFQQNKIHNEINNELTRER